MSTLRTDERRTKALGRFDTGLIQFVELAIKLDPERCRVSCPAAALAIGANRVSATGSSNRLRLTTGGGTKADEQLTSRDAVVRVLIETGADLLLRRISPTRAEEIQRTVDEILCLFDEVDETFDRWPRLKTRLDFLEALMTETRALKTQQNR